jgi:drug/metabolite transporter (DMT)-like permease
MLYLILTSLVWAFSYGLIKTKLGNLDPSFITVCRMTCAALVFMPLLRLRTLNKQQTWQLMLIGGVQYGLMYLCFLHSFKYLDAYQAALFTTMTPLYVILVNDLLQRKLHTYYLQVALLAVLGGVVIYYKNINQPGILTGFLLVQGSDLCFAFGQVAYKRLRTQAPQLRDSQVYALLFIGALIPAVIATTISAGWHSATLITSQQFMVLIYLGVVASGVCFFLWNKGGVLTNTATLAVFNNLKSPLAITVSIVFFNESTNITRLIIGMTLIGIALWLAERHAKRVVVTPQPVTV